jgi:photosystem II stability/assembly factor-like uncharacterized protein
MKTIAITLSIFFISFFHLFSQVQWESVQTPVSENFTSVWILDTGKIIIVSDQGTIVKTNDGGVTWNTSAFAGNNFRSIYFLDNLNGAFVSNGTNVGVFKTNDGGENWQSFAVDSLDTGNALFLTNNNNIYVVGSFENKNNIRISYDGGLNWVKSFMPYIIGSEFYDIFFRDENNGIMVGTDGVFYSTNDGGALWGMNITFPVVNLNAIYNFGEQYGIVVGDEGKAFFTINDWYQYIDLNTNVAADLNGVWGAPGTFKMWAVGDSGTILFSEYYPLGWLIQNSGTTENLNDVFILNENFGVAVGDNGTVLFMSNPNSVGELSRNAEISVFPNPFKNKTKIRYDISSQCPVELKVFDLPGNEVLSLFKGEKQPGSYEIVFDASGLHSGIYFVRLNAGSYSTFKKIVITGGK